MSGGQHGPAVQGRLARLEVWERLEQPVIAALPYVMLAVASLLAVALEPGTRTLVLVLGVSAATVAWMLFGFTLHPAWRENRAWLAVFLVVLIALMATLVIWAPIYGVFTFVTYYFTFAVPQGRWRFAAIAAIAVVTATSQDGGLPKGSAGGALYAGLILINIAFAAGINWFGAISTERDELRKQALAELSEANRKLEATLAENAGLQKQLLTSAREAGVQDERQRMAREIHDTLAQSLAGIITQLQAGDQAGQASDQRRHRDAALALARDGLSEARRSVHALRPEPLQAGRIEDAIATVAQRWSALHGVTAAVTTTGPRQPIPAEAEVVLLRTAQEALANVGRHAEARTVRLTLSYIGDQVTLDVRDDGIGFCPGPAAGGPRPGGPPGQCPPPPGADGTRGGFGLTAMRERVEGLSGTLEVESEPGQGTTVCASLPVSARSSR